MTERWVVVTAPDGLHARLSARIVGIARSTRARLAVVHRGRRADGTSLTALLALGADAGALVRLLAEGEDAEAALDRLARLLSQGPPVPVYRGMGVSPGVGSGRAVLAAETAAPLPAEPTGDPEGEVRRLRAALAAARGELAALAAWAEREIGAASDVLRAERELLTDPVWLGLLEGRIREGRMTAEAAVWVASHEPDMMPPVAEGGPPDGLREVLRDVGNRVTRLLARAERPAAVAEGEAVVLVARHVSPSDLLEWPRERLAGVVAAVGSAQAHAALVARALGVPMVVGIGEPLPEEVRSGPVLTVDGTRGAVVLAPAGVLAPVGERAVTWPAGDGVPAMVGRPAILANADTLTEVREALAAGAEGIGLVRTEWLYLARDVPPSEDEQYEALRAIAAACAGRPLTLRLADLGGSKGPAYLLPLLGAEGLRRGAALLRRYPALAAPHLRAVARVAREFAVTVMIPMVATRDEWSAMLALWREAARGAGAEAAVSLFVETPAAALDVTRLLAEADEVSIGTNDLGALLFGVDRERAEAPHLALEPVLLRLIAAVMGQAHRAGLVVTICGEDAGRLPEALVLWGLGADKLSVAPRRVAALAYALGTLAGEQARAVAGDVLAMDDAAQVLARLEAWRRDLASRGMTIPNWPEGWEGHGDRNDLGGWLA